MPEGAGWSSFQGLDDWRLFDLAQGPWVVQPLGRVGADVGCDLPSMSSVAAPSPRSTSRWPASSRMRFASTRCTAAAADPSRSTRVAPWIAERAVRTVAERLGADLSYARIDLMEWQGQWVVSELELIEPGLYLDVAPEIAQPFAELVASRGSGLGDLDVWADAA